MQKMMYLLVSQHVSDIIMPIIRRMVQNLLVGYLFTSMITSHDLSDIMNFEHIHLQL
jgi:hypothetical protein